MVPEAQVRTRRPHLQCQTHHLLFGSVRDPNFGHRTGRLRCRQATERPCGWRIVWRVPGGCSKAELPVTWAHTSPWMVFFVALVLRRRRCCMRKDALFRKVRRSYMYLFIPATLDRYQFQSRMLKDSFLQVLATFTSSL